MDSLKTAFHRTGTHRQINVLSDFISHKKKQNDKKESKTDRKHLQVNTQLVLTDRTNGDKQDNRREIKEKTQTNS